MAYAIKCIEWEFKKVNLCSAQNLKIQGFFKIGNNLSKKFEIQKSFTQGNNFPTLFNISLEIAIQISNI